MENFFALYACATSTLILLVCIIIKTIYWKKSGRIGITRLVRSFFKWYKPYHVFNASSGNRQAFMRISNLINVIFWSIFFVGLICVWLIIKYAG